VYFEKYTQVIAMKLFKWAFYKARHYYKSICK